MKKFAIRSCSLIMALVLAIGLCISASATEFAPYASDYLSNRGPLPRREMAL